MTPAAWAGLAFVAVASHIAAVALALLGALSLAVALVLALFGVIAPGPFGVPLAVSGALGLLGAGLAHGFTIGAVASLAESQP